MSKAYNSPTARLLQSSRLFSLPRPLPPAALETPNSTGQYRASETATAYYPTHQAITTPSSSHFRGDWGLKRAIPGKTTKSSTPSIRLLGQDTPDHITDFESAADHERSRAKFAEMGIHITTREGDKEMSHQSVYEDFLDNTDPEVTMTTGTGSDASVKVQAKRWKYSGPWIAGMQEGQFQRYLDKQLASRKDEWNELVTDFTAEKRFEAERRAAQKAGRYFGPLESASPSLQAEMAVEQAERQGRQFYASALETGDDAAEADAKRKSEQLIAQAREFAEKCQLDMQRWEAPAEAKLVWRDAERQAREGRRAIERDIKRYELAEKRLHGEQLSDDDLRNSERMTFEQIEEGRAEIEARRPLIDQALERAAEQAGRVLQADEQGTSANILQLISTAEALITEDKAARTATQSAWEAAHLISLRPAASELPQIQRDLREGFKTSPLASEMANLIVKFLDMPPIFDMDKKRNPFDVGEEMAATLNSRWGVGETDKPPPTTHPGAGLSYLRTNAVMENHPTQGPLAQRSAIQARVLAARSGAKANTGSSSSTALLGVGGFTVADSKLGPVGRSGAPSKSDPTDALDDITPGGGKVYIHPLSATIDETGRVVLRTVRADDEAVAVKKGTIEEHDQLRRNASENSTPVMPGNIVMPPRLVGSSGVGGFGFGQTQEPKANYGTGLPNMRQLAADEAKYGTGSAGQRQGAVRARGFEDVRQKDGNKAFEEIARLGGFKR